MVSSLYRSRRVRSSRYALFSLLLACGASVQAQAPEHTQAQPPRGITPRAEKSSSGGPANDRNAATGYTGNAASPNTPGAMGGGVKPDTPGTMSSSGMTTAGSTPLNSADMQLLHEMASSNIAEIEAAKLAKDHSKNAQVRSLAQKLIDDHTKAQSELTALARAKRAQLPTETDDKHKKLMQKLSGLQGDAFDREFIAMTGMEDHQNTRKLLEKVSSQATDADLRTLAQKMLPTIDQHMQTAKNVRGAKGPMSSSGR